MTLAPSRSDPVARSASAVVGGPAGRRLASAIGFWGAVPVLVLLAALTIATGVVTKEHCRAQGWTTPDQFFHTCYSDIPVLFGSAALGGPDRAGLSDSLAPGGLNLPPLTGTAMWLVSAFAGDGADGARAFFDLSAVVLFVVLAVGIAAVAVATGRAGRPWDAAHLALSPVLVAAALISYQLLTVMLVALAVAAWTRGRTTWAGVVGGLAVSAAPVTLLLAPAAVVLAIRERRPGPALGATAWGAGTWLVLRVLLLPGLGGLGTAWSAWKDSAPGYGSLWLVPQLLEASRPTEPNSVGARILVGLFGWIFTPHALSGGTAAVLTVLLLLVLLPVTVWFALGGGLTPSALPPRSAADARDVRVLAPLALALVVVGLLSMRSLPVQASLVLLPLIALAGLPWRDHLIWAAVELTYFVGVWLYIAADSVSNRGLPADFYLVLLVARLAAIAYLGVRGVLVCRERLRSSPRHATFGDRFPADAPA